MSRQIEAGLHFESVGATSQLQIPRDAGGRIKWKKLSNEPEKFALAVETDVRKLCEPEGKACPSILLRHGRNDLVLAIKRYYPGKWPRLRENLGLPGLRKDNYWNNPETIENEAREFYTQSGDINWENLIANKKSSLAMAIKTYYPGGVLALRDQLGIGGGKKPSGYWNRETVEVESAAFLSAHGQLTYPLLRDNGRSDMIHAVHKFYPGGIRALKESLGIIPSNKPNGYWKDPANIIIEVKEATASGIAFTEENLKKTGRSSLAAAIATHYPGGIKALRQDLGLSLEKRQPVWSAERIEKEASDFVEKYGAINHNLLIKHHLSKLSSAISKQYPGAWRALRIAIGIYPNTSPNVVPVDIANDQLGKLLEVGGK